MMRLGPRPARDSLAANNRGAGCADRGLPRGYVIVMSKGGFLALVYRTLARFVRPPVDETIQTAIRPPRVCYSGFDPGVRGRTAERRRREEAARRAANRIASGAPIYPVLVEPAVGERSRRP